jgi:hypothetical protein
MDRIKRKFVDFAQHSVVIFDFTQAVAKQAIAKQVPAHFIWLQDHSQRICRSVYYILVSKQIKDIDEVKKNVFTGSRLHRRSPLSAGCCQTSHCQTDTRSL